MPKGTRVHRCVDKVKKSGRGVNPYAVCQASTDQSYATGKTLQEIFKKQYGKSINKPPKSRPDAKSSLRRTQHPNESPAEFRKNQKNYIEIMNKKTAQNTTPQTGRIPGDRPGRDPRSQEMEDLMQRGPKKRSRVDANTEYKRLGMYIYEKIKAPLPMSGEEKQRTEEKFSKMQSSPPRPRRNKAPAQEIEEIASIIASPVAKIAARGIIGAIKKKKKKEDNMDDHTEYKNAYVKKLVEAGGDPPKKKSLEDRIAQDAEKRSDYSKNYRDYKRKRIEAARRQRRLKGSNRQVHQQDAQDFPAPGGTSTNPTSGALPEKR